MMILIKCREILLTELIYTRYIQPRSLLNYMISCRYSTRVGCIARGSDINQKVRQGDLSSLKCQLENVCWGIAASLNVHRREIESKLQKRLNVVF